MHDQAILYNSLYSEVKLAIENIKALGFDVTEYESILSEINSKVNDNVRTKYVKGMAEASYISFYMSGIKELNSLKSKLETYDIYVKAYNICNYIEMKLNHSVQAEEIDKMISQMIYVLLNISKSPTIDYTYESHIIEKIYAVAYNLIKMELILKGESNLYLFINNKLSGTSYFNTLVLRDVDKLDLKDEKNRLIKMKMFQIGGNGIYSDYLDIELIKLILLRDESINLKGKIIDTLNSLVIDIKENSEKIVSNYSEYDTYADENSYFKHKINSYRKDLIKKIISLVCTLICVFWLGIRIPKLAKKISTGSAYTKTTRTYSTLSNSYEEEQTEIIRKSDIGDSVIVVTYSEADKNGDQVCKKYNLSEYSFASPEDYYDYVMKDSRLRPYESGLTSDTKSHDSYAEVISNSYEYHGESVDKDGLMIGTFFMYFLYVISLVIFNLTYLNFNDQLIITSMFNKILAYGRALRDSKKEYKVYLDKLSDILDELMKEINKDEKLREKFNILFEQNKFLLDNPEELMRRLDEIDVSYYVNQSKKLVKKNGKD